MSLALHIPSLRETLFYNQERHKHLTQNQLLLGVGGSGVYTPPGVGIPPDDASVVANLKLWYKINALGLANNDPITTATDYSASAEDLTGAGAARPTYLTGQQNGLPGAAFDDNDYLDNNAIGSWLTGAAGFTMILVFKKGAGSGNDWLFNFAGVTSENTGLMLDATTAYCYVNVTPTSSFRYAALASPSAAHVYSIVYDGNGSGNAGRLKTFDGGVAVTMSDSGTIPALTGTADKLSVGREYNQASYYLGQFYEAAVYNIAVAATLRNNIELYLGNKWGIGVS